MRRQLAQSIAVVIGLMLSLSHCGRSARASGRAIVVADFGGSRRAKALRRQAKRALLRALQKEGLDTPAYSDYRDSARASGIRLRRVLAKRSIRRIAGETGLDGLVVGTVIKKRRHFVLTVSAMDAEGNQLLKRSFRLKRQRLSTQLATSLAKDVTARLPEQDPFEEMDELSESPAPAAPESLATKRQVVADAGPQKSDITKEPEWSGSLPDFLKRTTRKKQSRRYRKPGSVPDLQLTLGASMNQRSGLHPPHQTEFVPGALVSGRIFMGVVTDLSILRDVGLAGLYHQVLSLKYSKHASAEEWEAHHHHWSGELLYRLSFENTALAPGILLRAGYGSHVSDMSSIQPGTISATYTYPYGGLELHFMLVQPELRVFASGRYSAWVEGDLETIEGSQTYSGSVYSVGGGIELVLFGGLALSLNYEMSQFSMAKGDDRQDDRYHVLSANLGWAAR